VVAAFYRLLRWTRSPRGLWVPGGSVLAVILAACGSSTRPQVSSITFTTDATGQTPICTTGAPSANAPACTAALLPALVAGGSPLYLFADVSGDNLNLGVTWTVTCAASGVGNGGVNTSCGTFVPSSTFSGPVPLYPEAGIVTTFNGPTSVPKGAKLTITAAATSLPSESLSISLNVTAAASAKMSDSEEPPPKCKAHPPSCVSANNHSREAVRPVRGDAWKEELAYG
jgi:hypothetical protein